MYYITIVSLSKITKSSVVIWLLGVEGLLTVVLIVITVKFNISIFKLYIMKALKREYSVGNKTVEIIYHYIKKFYRQ